MRVEFKWKMYINTTVLLMFTILLAQAGRLKKQSFKQLKNFSHIRRNVSADFGLWPSSFNLATKAIISANATCGENGREDFCRMIENSKGRCGICDNFGTDSGKRHPISYAIDGSNRWWQSPALFYGTKYEYVTITIDLKQVYQVTDVIIKAANSLRPGTWILERSLDRKNYLPWQYFARSDRECFDRFGIPGTKGKPHYITDTQVICTSFYSKLIPMENGEIHTSLVNGRPGATEASPELLEFSKARYVRLRLMGLRSNVEPLPRWFLQDILKEKKQFYTIRDISIIGHCVCNGHADSCRHNVASGHPECECAHHTCGPNCEKCCPMYNQRQWGPGSSRDARQCLPCNCHGHATSCHYSEEVDKAGRSIDINGNYQGGGVCNNCTGYTTGINCERCLSGYYRTPDTVITAERPCIKCDCAFPGSTGKCVQEGILAGTCDCLPGYEGKKCEYCAPSFRGWPKCETCPCDPRGTHEMQDCEGNCTCKRNVRGKLCDQCKPGYFALNVDNPDGCAECYCSGITTVCEATSTSPKKIETLENWLTTDLKVSVVASPIRDNKGLFSIGSYELPHAESLYWLAPISYLGNKLEYYGSFFTFKVHWVIMRGDTSGRPTVGPNIILVGSNGLKIAHGNDSFTVSNTTFNIELREDGWYHLNGNKPPVTRKEFLGLLSNISRILLRATFHTDQIESLLEQAVLNTNGDVKDVEKCSCPSGYSGLSCESCAFGYVKITTAIKGHCGKCDCNGHSETCDVTSGECTCLHNTTGENCERCKPGFYGNPLQSTQEDCKKCACPLEHDENNFSPSCQLDLVNEGGYVCTQCPKGYTGDHCEICDDGYFGNPMEIGNLCQPCKCNGGPCDKITGQCTSCKGNTEGWRCEKCKNGYYGNALLSNCMACQCDPIGALSKSCDPTTGQCQCRERFSGRTCNKCEPGYGNVTALCTRCSCNPLGSKSDKCDPQTGLCECRKGVDGFHCDACQSLYYGLSDDGCKECSCDKDGSKIQACDQNTGKCICKSHYGGDKCDRCEAGYWKSNSGCKPCDCNYDGSRSPNCDGETGKCPCKPGVQGQKCDACQEHHYGNVTTGCKACDPCEKIGHICHPENGKCVCPPFTRGQKCERCVPNAWGWEPSLGCSLCRCSDTGGYSQQCDIITGRCSCKLGYEEAKCDKCSLGFYNYPNCSKCNCAIAGTKPEDCSHGTCKCSESGCNCKTNVEGRSCDQCKKGTFGMDVDHPDGCIHCFCSNRSRTCSASRHVWHQIRSNSNLDRLIGTQCMRKSSCWKLPINFTGDFTDSYGGYLRIKSDLQGNSVYMTGNGLTVKSSTDPRGDIKMTETFWKIENIPKSLKIMDECGRNQLTRPCLMIILQNISQILIEPTAPVDDMQVSEVLLDKLSNTPGVEYRAKTVEQCVCPPNYTSASCQDPSTGYYRYYPKSNENEYNYVDRIIGIAKPCQCNNRSNICNPQTGHCLKCENFTTGPHCELCAEGYFLNSTGSCSPCQCPSEQQNFSKNCSVTSKGFTCTCKPGYTGPRCNKCEDYYWGKPETPGGSCRKCNCNRIGSVASGCNSTTGQCKCKPGFIGDKCSKCSSPRQVIENGVCLPCDECTQILFHILDDSSTILNSLVHWINKGSEPPWSLLNNTISQYTDINGKYAKIKHADEIIKNANISQVEKKIEKIEQDVRNRDMVLNSRTNRIKNIQNESEHISLVMKTLERMVNDVLKNIEKFDYDALDEAEQLLNRTITMLNEYKKIDHRDLFDRCKKQYDYIKRNTINNSNTSDIKTKLDMLANRLLKFNKILNRTEQNSKLAKKHNEQNAKRIEKLKRSINDLNENNGVINKNITQLLTKLNVTNNLVQEMTNFYEALPKVDIQDATRRFDNETFDALLKVREHVRNLQSQLKIHKSRFNFTPEEWTKIDASGAYEKILHDVNSANKQAREARNITWATLKKLHPLNDDSLPDKTNLATAFSDRILKRVQNLENLTGEFRRKTDELEKLKHAVLMNGKSNNELNFLLRQIHKNVTKQFENVSQLEEAKKNARNTTSLMGSVEQSIKDINITMQYDLTKSYQKYVDLLPYKYLTELKGKLNKTRDDFSRFDKTAFDEIENATKLNLITTDENIRILRSQIEHLRSEILHANELVQAISYGIKIAKCERTFKMNNDVFQSLEMHFKCNDAVLLTLFSHKNDTIRISCGESKVNISWSNQTISYANNGTMYLQRRGSRIEILDKHYIPYQDLFHIDRLLIGDLNNIDDTCIYNVTINHKTVGLWKFSGFRGNCSACYRSASNVETEDPWGFFAGNGYRKILERDVKNLEPNRLTFVIDFATFDENSLIFIAIDKTNSSSYIALHLEDGHLVLSVKHIDGTHVRLETKEKYNNGLEQTAEIRMFYDRATKIQQYNLSVLGDNDNKAVPLSREHVYKIKKSEIFIGGIESNKSSVPVSSIRYAGDLKVKLRDSVDVARHNSLSFNVEPRKNRLRYHKVWFSGKGFVELDFKNLAEGSEITFILKPVNVSNHFVMTINENLNIYLNNSHLMFNEHVIEYVCANFTNLIGIHKNGTVRVNGEEKKYPGNFPTGIFAGRIHLYLGSKKTNTEAKNFIGTMSDFFFGDNPLSFNATSIKQFSNVEIGRDKLSSISKTRCVKEMQNTERYFIRPDYKTEPQAFKFGDKPYSHVLVKNLSVGKKFILEFHFRTFYPNGLLFYANSQSANNRNVTFYTVLEIQGGDLKLRVQGRKSKTMKIVNRINDGVWHHVQVEQILGKRKWRLVIKVDKQYKIKERTARNNFNGDVYFGGIKEKFNVHKKLTNELHPLRGCIRFLKINRSLQVVKNNNNVFYNNIGQCFQNVEEGAYFGGDAFAVYKYDFKVNNFLELSFEFKTSEPNGILLSVSNLGNSPALSVELQNGAVVMTIDMGNGIISRVANSPHSDFTLANNEWHNITALYSSSELTVNVDGIRKSWVQSDLHSMMNEIKAPLFIGGLPSNAPSGTLKIRENFSGCIRKFKIEDVIMDWTDMKEMNNVQLNSCLV